MSSNGCYTEQVHGPVEYLDLGNFELARRSAAVSTSDPPMSSSASGGTRRPSR
jgi:hypothetical protein